MFALGGKAGFFSRRNALVFFFSVCFALYQMYKNVGMRAFGGGNDEVREGERLQCTSVARGQCGVRCVCGEACRAVPCRAVACRAVASRGMP